MKKILCVALFTALFSLSSLTSEAAMTLRLGNKQIENHHESVALRKFAELVEERTNGEIRIEIFYGEALGDSGMQIQNVISGLQDFYADGYGFYEPYVKDFRAFDIPYLFRDNEAFRRFLLSDIVKEMEAELLQKTGLRMINTEKNWLRGPYRVLASRHPIRGIDDIRGLKLRMPPGAPTSIRAWSLLGATVSPIPWSETYLALSQGMVDAVTSPVTDVYFQRFFEVTPFVTVTYEYSQQVAITMNERRFQSLTPEQQAIIVDSINEAGQLCWELVTQNGENLVQLLKDEHNIEFFNMDTEPMRQIMEGLMKELEAEDYITPGLVERINNLN